MTELNETDKYIKCSKCRCKYTNSDDSIKKDFGYNRLNERYKTCVTCKDKQKKRRENSKKEEKKNSDKEIKDEHYDEVDKELRKKYDEEFKLDSHDKHVKRCTEEQQVDRYARMLFFWDINQVLNPHDVINDPKKLLNIFTFQLCEVN